MWRFVLVVLLDVDATKEHEPLFLDADMKAEVLGYQMSPKPSRESERFKNYSSPNLELWFATFIRFILPPAMKVTSLPKMFSSLLNNTLHFVFTSKWRYFISLFGFFAIFRARVAYTHKVISHDKTYFILKWNTSIYFHLWFKSTSVDLDTQLVATAKSESNY